MTRTGYARIAGFVFLFYIATGVVEMVLFERATGGAVEPSAVLASLARHAPLARGAALLTFLMFVDAVVLAVALFALTREVEPDLAMLALVFRVAEGVLGAVAAVKLLGLLSIASAATSGDGIASAVGGLLLSEDRASPTVAAACFAAGSTLYSFLFLRARSIPVALAWLGIGASVLLLAGLLLQLAGLAHAPLTSLQWVPIAVFEVTLAFWLLLRGVTPTPGIRPSGRSKRP